MFNLILALLCSALLSVFMRLGSSRVQNNVGMLSANYITCTLLAACYAGFGSLLPLSDPALPKNLLMGCANGVFYLVSFILFQTNIRRSGVVLSSIFMKLGLLVPMVLSVLIFGEMPTVLQGIGFVIAVAAIILINFEKDESARLGFGLIALLLINGCADAMSKVFDEWGTEALSAQFLVYTFFVAMLLCLGYMAAKKQRIGKTELLYGFLIGIPNFFSAKFLLKALESIPAVITYPTFSVGTILLVSLVGVLLFKEKLKKRQWIAIVIILIALALLNT